MKAHNFVETKESFYECSECGECITSESGRSNVEINSLIWTLRMDGWTPDCDEKIVKTIQTD